MPEILQKIRWSADDDLDSVVLRIDDMRQRIGYLAGFRIDQALRMGAKQVAEFYGAPARFWRELDLTHLDDCPRPHRTPRQSRHVATYKNWEVRIQSPPLVTLLFDGVGKDLEMELAVKIGHGVRRASRRAKAWAGDSSRGLSVMAHITDANAPNAARPIH